jgi:hypothetical protein
MNPLVLTAVPAPSPATSNLDVVGQDSQTAIPSSTPSNEPSVNLSRDNVGIDSIPSLEEPSGSSSLPFGTIPSFERTIGGVVEEEEDKVVQDEDAAINKDEAPQEEEESVVSDEEGDSMPTEEEGALPEQTLAKEEGITPPAEEEDAMLPEEVPVERRCRS